MFLRGRDTDLCGAGFPGEGGSRISWITGRAKAGTPQIDHISLSAQYLRLPGTRRQIHGYGQSRLTSGQAVLRFQIHKIEKVVAFA